MLWMYVFSQCHCQVENLLLPGLVEELSHGNAKSFASSSQKNVRTKTKQAFKMKTIAWTVTAISLSYRLYYIYLTWLLKISVSFLNEHKTDLNYFLFYCYLSSMVWKAGVLILRISMIHTCLLLEFYLWYNACAWKVDALEDNEWFLC